MASAAADVVDVEVEDEAFLNLQRLKAALHYSVGQICEEIGEKKGITFSKPMMAAVAELTLHQAQTFAADLEQFAKHAKRLIINEDDVKLLVRRNEKLRECICKLSADIHRQNEAEKERKKTRKRKKDVSNFPQDSGTSNV